MSYSRKGLAVTAAAVALAFTISACLSSGAGPPAQTGESGLPTPAPETAAAATDAPVTAAPNPTDGGAGVGEPDLGTGRPVQVSVTVGGTTTAMDGTYEGAGLARACGNAALNLTGNTKSFNLYFPQDEAGAVDDVTFDADDLLAGTSTNAFYINVNVTTPTGHAPPAVVIDTREGSGDTGTAQRTSSDGSTTLTLNATNRFGETISLTATCGPRP